MAEQTVGLMSPGDMGHKVGEAIRIHQGLRGRSLLDKIIDALRRVRIPAPESRIKDYPHQMSGGMRQRVFPATAGGIA